MVTHILRNAGPNEKRCIIRHHLGFYTNISAAAIYSIPRETVPESTLQQHRFYALPLVNCIEQHPFLSATIHDAGTNNPSYTRPDNLDVEARVRILQLYDLGIQADFADDDEVDLMREVLEQIHNNISLRFTSVEAEPAWALDVVPLTTRSSSDPHRVLISYTYSHSHGDGVSGIIFHKTYREEFEKCLTREPTQGKVIFKLQCTLLPDQPDTSTKLPISLSYLLLPALGTYLPTFLTKWFGLSGDVSGGDDQTWTGSATFVETDNDRPKALTNVEVIEVEAETLDGVLALCRKNDIKLTALLNQVIAQAMCTTLLSLDSELGQHANFVATTPVNLRRVLRVPLDTIGNFGGAAYLRYDLRSVANVDDASLWERLRAQGEHLSRVASTAQDQPIGLLRFVANFVTWMNGQIGQARDCSWELSNLGSFDPQQDIAKATQGPTVHIQKLFFSQPASAVGPPITYNAVGMKGGSLTICICWQPGALGLKGHVDKPDERGIVKAIGASIKGNLKEVTLLMQ